VTAPDLTIEEVKDLDAAWNDLTALYLEFEDYSSAFRSRALSANWSETWRDQVAPNDDRLVLMAFRNDQAVGYLVMEIVSDFPLFDEPFGYLKEAFVRTETRSQGIGQEMLACAEAWCRRRGILDLRLDVWAANESATRFWTLAGFELQSMTMKKTLK
jgi:GNAT superfamily N-acetyltransferase